MALTTGDVNPEDNDHKDYVDEYDDYDEEDEELESERLAALPHIGDDFGGGLVTKVVNTPEGLEVTARVPDENAERVVGVPNTVDPQAYKYEGVDDDAKAPTVVDVVEPDEADEDDDCEDCDKEDA